MQPTNKLRYVKRKTEVVPLVHPGGQTVVQMEKILQQWWAESEISLGWASIEPSKRGEWRDVPVVEE